jgi:hypothetical protein
MTPTVKAILARFNGDSWQAIQYCIRMARHAFYGQYKNPDLAREYETLAVEIRLQAKVEAAHA